MKESSQHRDMTRSNEVDEDSHCDSLAVSDSSNNACETSILIVFDFFKVRLGMLLDIKAKTLTLKSDFSLLSPAVGSRLPKGHSPNSETNQRTQEEMRLQEANTESEVSQDETQKAGEAADFSLSSLDAESSGDSGFSDLLSKFGKINLKQKSAILEISLKDETFFLVASVKEIQFAVAGTSPSSKSDRFHLLVVTYRTENPALSKLWNRLKFLDEVEALPKITDLQLLVLLRSKDADCKEKFSTFSAKLKTQIDFKSEEADSVLQSENSADLLAVANFSATMPGNRVYDLLGIANKSFTASMSVYRSQCTLKVKISELTMPFFKKIQLQNLELVQVLDTKNWDFHSFTVTAEVALAGHKLGEGQLAYSKESDCLTLSLPVDFRSLEVKGSSKLENPIELTQLLKDLVGTQVPGVKVRVEGVGIFISWKTDISPDEWALYLQLSELSIKKGPIAVSCENLSLGMQSGRSEGGGAEIGTAMKTAKISFNCRLGQDESNSLCLKNCQANLPIAGADNWRIEIPHQRVDFSISEVAAAFLQLKGTDKELGQLNLGISLKLKTVALLLDVNSKRRIEEFDFEAVGEMSSKCEVFKIVCLAVKIKLTRGKDTDKKALTENEIGVEAKQIEGSDATKEVSETQGKLVSEGASVSESHSNDSRKKALTARETGTVNREMAGDKSSLEVYVLCVFNF
ncbi:MAG: hypothetical protein V2I33_18660, partial [Kangiellaceae bacterium]|nr:hypothetical protein [Kangiellaceae bacterium]